MVVSDKPASEFKLADGAGLSLTSTPPPNPSQPSKNDMPDNQDAGSVVDHLSPSPPDDHPTVAEMARRTAGLNLEDRPKLPFDVLCLVVLYCAPRSRRPLDSRHTLTVLCRVSKYLRAVAVRLLYEHLVYPGPRRHHRAYLTSDLFARSVPVAVPRSITFGPTARRYFKKHHLRKPEHQIEVLPSGVRFPNLRQVEIQQSNSSVFHFEEFLTWLTPQLDPSTLVLRAVSQPHTPTSTPAFFSFPPLQPVLEAWSNLTRIVFVDVFKLEEPFDPDLFDAYLPEPSHSESFLIHAPQLEKLKWVFTQRWTSDFPAREFWATHRHLFAMEGARGGLEVEVTCYPPQAMVFTDLVKSLERNVGRALSILKEPGRVQWRVVSRGVLFVVGYEDQSALLLDPLLF